MTATFTAACVQHQGLADMDARIEAATALARVRGQTGGQTRGRPGGNHL